MKEEKQITRVEIHLKLPRYIEDSSVVSEAEYEYWKDVCNRLGEVYIPTDFHRQIYDVEQEYNRTANPVTLYMLQQLDPYKQRHALTLMDPKTATFYRAALKTGDVDRINLDELALQQIVCDMLNDVLRPVKDGIPEYQESWYDARKRNEQKRSETYDIESIVERVYEKIRRSQTAPVYDSGLPHKP